ncbi:MAG: hypothetical protein EDM05_56690 [Leptolyngbya sp. IPPAS B-1204]|nr:hypothetical protein [Elainella sp. C42_A2020_010]
MMQRTLYLFLLLGSAVATLGITSLPMLVVPQIETSAQTSVQMTTQNFAAQE